MEKNNAIKKIGECTHSILSFKERSLVERSEWGTLNFKEAELDITRLFDFTSYLSVLPIEFLPDTALTKIAETLERCIPVLEHIDSFNLNTNSPTSAIVTYSNNLHSAVDSVYSEGAIWLPFLAYQKGDVTTNINKLNQTIEEGKKLVDVAQEDIRAKTEEIDKIVVATREAAASAGAAVFTEEFNSEAQALKNSSWWWLGATLLFAIAVGFVVVYTWYFPIDATSPVHLWQMLSSKLILISVLLTASLWCGRIYKAQLHQATINRQKALGLKTFQAFTRAASDTQTKDAVLREATHSIFAQMPTGYIDNKGTT